MIVPWRPGAKVGYEVDTATGCWQWRGAISPGGYGRCGDAARRTYQVHRVFWERVHGPIPPGLEPDHLCRNRACVNPAHLELVTRRVNARRGARTKLTPAMVREIRARYEQGNITLRELGAVYGVSHAHLSRVIRGEKRGASLHWSDI